MKYLHTLIFTFLALNIVWSQEEAVFTHFHLNPLLVNPGASGFDAEHHNIFLNFRSQWAGFPGSPKTYAISYNGPLGKRLGVGAMIFSESIAELNRLRGQASFAYKANVDKFDIALGLSVEYHQLRVSSNVMDGPFYEINDEVIEAAVDGITDFDASLGVFASFDKNTYIGLSIPSIVGTRLDEIAAGDDNSSVFRYYMFLLGHNFETGNSYSIEPAVLIKRVRNVPFQADITVKGRFLDNRLITGLAYRTGDNTGGSMGMLLGTKYKTLGLYYSYDIFLDEFQNYNGGSHEITLNFEIDAGDGKFDRSRKYRK